MLDKRKYVEEFKVLLEKKTGETYTYEEACEHFNRLYQLLKVIYKPIPGVKEEVSLEEDSSPSGDSAIE